MKRVIFLMQDRIRWACPIGQLESMHQVMNSLELLKHEKSHHHLPPSWGLQWQEFQPTLGTGLSLLCVRHLVKMPMKKVSSSLLKQKKPGPRLKKKKILFQKSPLLEQQLQQTSWVKPSELSHFWALKMSMGDRSWTPLPINTSSSLQ